MPEYSFNIFRLTVLAAFSLSACVTAPAGGPPNSDAPMSAGGFASTLHLCKGDHIDNAPPTDSGRHIINYRPFANVAGVSLARAPVRRACFSSGFGFRHDRPRRHNGIDLSTGHPHAVYAAADGVVEEMRSAGGYGKMLLIRHNGRVKTRYAHLSAFASSMHIGHDVRQGDVIGKTGKTGNAEAVILHYEIIFDGEPRDPMAVGF
ncbi:M23 family metallopeptidase [Hyphococcus flavus]|uniref:M23 family metallopeptidase n=2 Tax=Hyphococcus TaxID=2038635 RepID=A0AAE9ZF04_9PROT|nr:M23 family metallopeptidase [Hyphococcus flavus]WDI31957.1 M23 family metallopeptidase [Hyphococcus flavus]